MLEDLAPDAPETEPASNHTQRYLKNQEEAFYQRLQTRRLIESLLLFTACQASSAAMAFLLFHFAISVVVISLLCAVISLVPTLGEWSGFTIHKTSEHWELSFMHKPIITLFKTAVGIVVAYVSVKAVAAEIEETNHQILAVYDEIKNYEILQKTHYPVEVIAIVAAIALVGMALLFRR
jgi:hypothetical protein